VKPGLKLRHVLDHEATILPDRIAAHRAGRLGHQACRKPGRPLRPPARRAPRPGPDRSTLIGRASFDSSRPSRRGEASSWLTTHTGDSAMVTNWLSVTIIAKFNDAVALRFQTGHFHIQPNEVIGNLCHIIHLNCKSPIVSQAHAQYFLTAVSCRLAVDVCHASMAGAASDFSCHARIEKRYPRASLDISLLAPIRKPLTMRWHVPASAESVSPSKSPFCSPHVRRRPAVTA
jgi:hypothetical protein